MEKDTILIKYLQITEGKMGHEYASPEAQGEAIKKCSILKSVEIQYSNSSSCSIYSDSSGNNSEWNKQE